MANQTKHRYWTAVMYQENMRPDWRDTVGDLLQLPYAYCEHTQDRDGKSEHRKDHVHFIVAFPSTTTYNNAMRVFAALSADGKKALNTCEPVTNIRHMYDYLIHDTETCRKQGKELYDKAARITGNNFDIGAYEQISQADKAAMRKELCQLIVDNGFCNFMDFYEVVAAGYDDPYLEIIATYSGLFERLTKGNYQRWQMTKEVVRHD